MLAGKTRISSKPVKNVHVFKYPGHMIIIAYEDPSCYLNFRISSAFHKWNEIKHALTDRKILVSIRARILEVCVHSQLFYSAQAWEVITSELGKLILSGIISSGE